MDHFRRCQQLQETIWRGLPRIAAGLGKRVRYTRGGQSRY